MWAFRFSSYVHMCALEGTASGQQSVQRHQFYLWGTKKKNLTLTSREMGKRLASLGL